MKKIYIAVFIAVLLTPFLSTSIMAESDRITIKGSTTVLPIAQRTAEVFMNNHPNVAISVQGGGSSVGIAAIIDGTCDIADASRPMKETELTKAMDNGRNPTANVVAMDGIAVILHPSNPINGLTKQQIKDIYTGVISDWSKSGGQSGKIVVVSRDSSSGTFEAFNEKALDKARVRPDALLEASNQAVATVVSQTPQAIGYIGLGFITDKVKAITVNDTVCNKTTVLSGTYTLARPLFMYTDGKPKGIVKEYVDFVLSSEGQKLVEEEGYVALK